MANDTTSTSTRTSDTSRVTAARKALDRQLERVDAAARRQQQALEALASVLAATGSPVSAPLAPYGMPSPRVIAAQPPAIAAATSIALVHAIFQQVRRPCEVTKATKDLGNAARGVRRALAPLPHLAHALHLAIARCDAPVPAVKRAA